MGKKKRAPKVKTPTVFEQGEEGLTDDPLLEENIKARGLTREDSIGGRPSEEERKKNRRNKELEKRTKELF